MSFLNIFGRQRKDEQQYASVLEEEEEDKMLPQQSQPSKELLELQKSNTNLKRILGIFIATFCLFGALVVFGNSKFEKYNSLMIPQILRTPVPPMPMNTHVFERNELYASRPSPATDEAWNALLPNGRGFVFVEESEKYGLPPGESTYFGEIYSVSLFHQLHCLGQLRKYHWMLIDGIKANDTVNLNAMADALLGPMGEHVHHCFDYLRQTLQCAGDMALEWPREEPDGHRFAVDGWGIPHECRSWDHIVDYMRDNHFNASTNNEIAPDHPMMRR